MMCVTKPTFLRLYRFVLSVYFSNPPPPPTPHKPQAKTTEPADVLYNTTTNIILL